MTMTNFEGKAASWTIADGVFELELHREPCNEIGTVLLADLERFVDATRAAENDANAIIIHSTMKPGFSAGADLRELYGGMQGVSIEERIAGVRRFLERIHTVMNALDASPLVTIAAVHGVTFRRRT